MAADQDIRVWGLRVGPLIDARFVNVSDWDLVLGLAISGEVVHRWCLHRNLSGLLERRRPKFAHLGRLLIWREILFLG